MNYHVEFSSDGSLPLPSELVEALGLAPGDPLTIARSQDGFTVRREEDASSALTRIRAALKGYSVDQFLAERRADWGE